jgi:hypothetical protein
LLGSYVQRHSSIRPTVSGVVLGGTIGFNAR